MKKPHLSVVATSRNDNHGGSLTYRMQHFVDGFVEQCKRHNLNAELILVEWNPPKDKPPLAEALRFPADKGPCSIRIIRVPPEIHQQFRHSEHLPLFQMIGKNVGIKRARGEFVLATNIDILFSDEIIKFMRDKLKKGVLYRCDRLDVPNELPETESFDEILDFCKKNYFRINGKYGTKNLNDPTPFFNISAKEIFCALLLFFKLKAQKARVAVIALFAAACKFGYRIFQKLFLHVRVKEKVSLLLSANWKKKGASLLKKFKNLEIRLILNKWLIEPFLRWKDQRREMQNGKKSHFILFCFFGKIINPVLSWKNQRKINYLIPFSFFNKTVNQFIKNAVFFAPGLLGIYKICRGSFYKMLGKCPSFYLHTNGCGDFTLMSSEDWEKLKAYPEWDIFSFHIDSVFLYQAYYLGIKEIDLPRKMAVYHIEHGPGSGYSAEAAHLLFQRLEEKQIAYLQYSDVIKMIEQMKSSKPKVIYNEKEWGISKFAMEEIVV